LIPYTTTRDVALQLAPLRYAAIVAGRQGEPSTHLMRPSGYLSMVGLSREREGGTARRLRRVAVS
jgi:hypothetical protein